MKRSSKRKVRNIMVKSIPSNEVNTDLDSLSPSPKALSKSHQTSDAASCDFADEIEHSCEQEDYATFYTNELEDEMSDEEYLWEENVERDEIEAAEKDRFTDEYELDNKDLMFDLFSEESISDSTTLPTLEESLVKALIARSPSEFFERFGKALDRALDLLKELYFGTDKSSHDRVNAKRNGHHKGLKQQLLVNAQMSTLKTLKFLTSCYAKRGLDELALLQDAVDLLCENDNDNLSLLIAGLASRVILEEQRNSRPRLSPRLRHQLLNAVQKTLMLLDSQDSIQALPGLAVTVGQRANISDCNLHTLPKMLYRSAKKVASSPHLQQRLINFKPTQRTDLSIDTDEMPFRVRINAPLEIIFQQHSGNRTIFDGP